MDLAQTMFQPNKLYVFGFVYFKSECSLKAKLKCDSSEQGQLVIIFDAVQTV